MIASYRALLTLAVSHAYYEGITEDFSFVVTADAARVLGRGRMLSRVDAGTLRVLFDGGTTGAPRVSMAGSTLRIGLAGRTPGLANVTDPPLPVAPNVSYYRNRTSPGALDAPEARALTGATLAHAITRATRPVTLTVEDDGGTPLATATVPTSDALTMGAASFDLGAVAPGPLSVKEDYGGGSVSTVLYYLCPELVPAGVSAVVDLAIASAFYTAAPAFQVALGAHQDTLKYYFVVTNYSGADFTALSVADAGFGDPADPRAQITFTRVESAAFAASDLPVALLALDGAQVVMFKSDAAVARRRRGRRKIQLSQNGDVLLENLPQPSADRADANMVLHLSK